MTTQEVEKRQDTWRHATEHYMVSATWFYVQGATRTGANFIPQGDTNTTWFRVVGDTVHKGPYKGWFRVEVVYSETDLSFFTSRDRSQLAKAIRYLLGLQLQRRVLRVEPMRIELKATKVLY